MKALTCEMCGSTDILKQDGVYVCQACGTKYTVEEAKKMMVEGTVDVKGTVKIDSSAEVSNMYELAKRAMDAEDYDEARDYFMKILLKEPNNWEALFYSAYNKFMLIDLDHIPTSTKNIQLSMKSALEIIKQSFDGDKLKDTVKELSEKIVQARKDQAIKDLNLLQNKPKTSNADESLAFYNKFDTYTDTKSSVVVGFGDAVDSIFGFKDISLDLWKSGYITLKNKEEKARYISKIQEVEPDFEPVKSGCYVATAVYGSYDCPEVWVLRRYRDYSLSKSVIGRWFIKFYYAISPKLVDIFGQNERVVIMVRNKLDSLVERLQSQGYDNKPYSDINWK